MALLNVRVPSFHFPRLALPVAVSLSVLGAASLVRPSLSRITPRVS